MCEQELLNAFIKLSIGNETLQEFRSDVTKIDKDGFNFKPFTKIINGKVQIRPAITYKSGNLRGFIDSDLNKDHRIYVEKFWTF